MSFYITGQQLREALAAIEAAEKNGFKSCRAVFDPLRVVGAFIELDYSDLWERGSELPQHDWGRFQGVTRSNKLVKGKLVKIELKRDR